MVSITNLWHRGVNNQSVAFSGTGSVNDQFVAFSGTGSVNNQFVAFSTTDFSVEISSAFYKCMAILKLQLYVRCI